MIASPSAGEVSPKSFYAEQCAFCHGAAGDGNGPAASMVKPPPTSFSRAAYWGTADRGKLADVILNGKPGTAMVPFSSKLDSQQAAEMVEFLETLSK